MTFHERIKQLYKDRQVSPVAALNYEELLTLRLADQVSAVVEDEHKVALEITKQKLKQ
jgi:hypothetical protein